MVDAELDLLVAPFLLGSAIAAFHVLKSNFLFSSTPRVGKYGVGRNASSTEGLGQGDDAIRLAPEESYHFVALLLDRSVEVPTRHKPRGRDFEGRYLDTLRRLVPACTLAGLYRQCDGTQGRRRHGELRGNYGGLPTDGGLEITPPSSHDGEMFPPR